METESLEEDVDVIFEDSVLHQALLDCQFSQVEVERRTTLETDMSNQVWHLTPSKQETTTSSFLARVIFSSHFLNELREYHRYKALQKLISSGLLQTDDKHFLQEFVEESPPCLPSQTFSVWTNRFLGLIVAMTVLVNLSPLTTALSPVLLVYVRLIHNVHLIHVYHDHATLVTLNFIWSIVVWLTASSIHKYLSAELLEVYKSQDRLLGKIESEACQLINLQKRCIRLLRESELVVRGFTIASYQYAVNMSSSYKSTVDGLCPELRLVILTQNAKLLQVFHTHIRSLAKSVELCVSDSDFSNLEDLQDELTASNKSCEKIPVSTLNKSVNLLQVYMSGCFRRVTLCFYKSNLKDKSVNPFEATESCLTHCTQALMDAHTAIREQYTYYRAVNEAMTRTSNDNVIPSKRSECLSNELQNFYICVNSLDLHIQSTLVMIRDLSTNLEARLDLGANNKIECQEDGDHHGKTLKAESSAKPVDEEISALDRQLWQNTLDKIKLNLDSVHNCYDESVRQINKHKLEHPSKDADFMLTPNGSVEAKEVKVKVLPEQIPEILDEVFEGSTELAGSEESDDDMEEWRKQRHQRKLDMAKQQEQRETMKILKQEIEAVVSHRAIIQREREERALARVKAEAMGGQIDDGCQEGKASLDARLSSDEVAEKQICVNNSENVITSIAENVVSSNVYSQEDKDGLFDEHLSCTSSQICKEEVKGIEENLTSKKIHKTQEKVREENWNCVLNKVEEECVSVSGLMSISVKSKCWKRPGPPRRNKYQSLSYVTPVNLVSVVAKSETCGSDGDTNENDRSKTKLDCLENKETTIAQVNSNCDLTPMGDHARKQFLKMSDARDDVGQIFNQHIAHLVAHKANSIRLSSHRGILGDEEVIGDCDSSDDSIQDSSEEFRENNKVI